MAVIGIDLGTTNSLAVAYVNGKVKMIPNQFNEYLTPSVVSIDEDTLIVGKIAKERLVTHPEHTANLFKRAMGTSKIHSLGKREFLPEELSALVVKQLVQDAKIYLNQEIEEIIISVPAYFNAKQREATKRIGEILDIKVERLINEPSAAAIACHEGDDFETFIVFDLGGGTLDISVVDCFENVISICAIAGDNNLGGSDFDLAIVEYFCKQHNIIMKDLNTSQQRSLLLNAERIKIQLQTNATAQMKAVINNNEYETIFNVDILTNISTPIFHKIKKVIAKAVRDSGFEADDLSYFIVVGGSSYMPIVVNYLMDLIRIPMAQNSNIDLLVAQGLGKYIGIKQRDSHIKDLVVTDICPFSLTTAVHNDQDFMNPLSHTIIPKNTVLPTSKSTTLSTITPYQKEVYFEVYQGDTIYAKDSLFLGNATLKLPNNETEEHQSFIVTYSYDINSMLYVEIGFLTNNEVHTFFVGNDAKLSKVENVQHLNTLRDISIKLDKQPEIELATQRAMRLYKEADDITKQQLQNQLLNFENLLKKFDNKLKKKLDLITKFNTFLDQVEKHQDIDSLDIFNQKKNEEEELLL